MKPSLFSDGNGTTDGCACRARGPFNEAVAVQRRKPPSVQLSLCRSTAFNEAVAVQRRKPPSTTATHEQGLPFNEAVAVQRRKLKVRIHINALDIPSMKPSLFSDGNGARCARASRTFTTFNEAVAVQRRKPRVAECVDAIRLSPSMKPSLFSDGNAPAVCADCCVLAPSMKPSLFSDGNVPSWWNFMRPRIALQ